MKREGILKRRRTAVLLLLLPCALAALGGCTPWTGGTNTPPTAAISAHPTTGISPLLVQFDAAASSDDAPLARYVWSFGDDSSSSDPAGSCCEHQFTHPGTYTVVLTVTDRGGLTSSASQEIVVQNTAPYASCRLSNDAPLPNETVQFDASGSLDLDGTIVGYTWDFGDGTTAGGAAVTHAYDEVGTYTVRLTVQDDSGSTATTTHSIYVHVGTSGGGCCGGGGICL
jgi:PKD repeat protein